MDNAVKRIYHDLTRGRSHDRERMFVDIPGREEHHIKMDVSVTYKVMCALADERRWCKHVHACILQLWLLVLLFSLL